MAGVAKSKDDHRTEDGDIQILSLVISWVEHPLLRTRKNKS